MTNEEIELLSAKLQEREAKLAMALEHYQKLTWDVTAERDLEIKRARIAEQALAVMKDKLQNIRNKISNWIINEYDDVLRSRMHDCLIEDFEI